MSESLTILPYDLLGWYWTPGLNSDPAKVTEVVCSAASSKMLYQLNQSLAEQHKRRVLQRREETLRKLKD